MRPKAPGGLALHYLSPHFRKGGEALKRTNSIVKNIFVLNDFYPNTRINSTSYLNQDTKR